MLYEVWIMRKKHQNQWGSPGKAADAAVGLKARTGLDVINLLFIEIYLGYHWFISSLYTMY